MLPLEPPRWDPTYRALPGKQSKLHKPIWLSLLGSFPSMIPQAAGTMPHGISPRSWPSDGTLHWIRTLPLWSNILNILHYELQQGALSLRYVGPGHEVTISLVNSPICLSSSASNQRACHHDQNSAQAPNKANSYYRTDWGCIVGWTSVLCAHWPTNMFPWSHLWWVPGSLCFCFLKRLIIHLCSSQWNI